MKALPYIGLLALLCFGTAYATQTTLNQRETVGFDNGYAIGWRARDAQVRDTDARLAASGMCVYAELACSGRKK